MTARSPARDLTVGNRRFVILCPPLTGCTTMAGFFSHPEFVLDCDRTPHFSTHGLTLSQRKAAFARLINDHDDKLGVCVPVLPDPSYADVTSCVVIIPASTFTRRLLATGQGRFADGHRVAAVQWRDEAIQIAAAYDLPVVSSLSAVPAFAHLSFGG